MRQLLFVFQIKECVKEDTHCYGTAYTKEEAEILAKAARDTLWQKGFRGQVEVKHQPSVHSRWVPGGEWRVDVTLQLG